MSCVALLVGESLRARAPRWVLSELCHCCRCCCSQLALMERGGRHRLHRCALRSHCGFHACVRCCACVSVAPVWINHVRGGLSVNPLPPCMGRSAAFAAPCCCQGGGARPLLFMCCACWPCVARRMPGFGLAVHYRFVIHVVCAMRTRCGMRADWKERPGSQKWPIDCSPDAGSQAIVAARVIAMRLHDGAHDGGRAQVWRLFAPSRRNLEVSLGVLPTVAQRAHAYAIFRCALLGVTSMPALFDDIWALDRQACGGSGWKALSGDRVYWGCEFLLGVCRPLVRYPSGLGRCCAGMCNDGPVVGTPRRSRKIRRSTPLVQAVSGLIMVGCEIAAILSYRANGVKSGAFLKNTVAKTGGTMANQ